MTGYTPLIMLVVPAGCRIPQGIHITAFPFMIDIIIIARHQSQLRTQLTQHECAYIAIVEYLSHTVVEPHRIPTEMTSLSPHHKHHRFKSPGEVHNTSMFTGLGTFRDTCARVCKGKFDNSAIEPNYTLSAIFI